MCRVYILPSLEDRLLLHICTAYKPNESFFLSILPTLEALHQALRLLAHYRVWPFFQLQLFVTDHWISHCETIKTKRANFSSKLNNWLGLQLSSRVQYIIFVLSDTIAFRQIPKQVTLSGYSCEIDSKFKRSPFSNNIFFQRSRSPDLDFTVKHF